MIDNPFFRIVLIPCVMLSVLFGPIHGQSYEQLNEKMKTLVEQQNLSGAVWTIVDGNGEIRTDACGYANLRTKEKLNPCHKMLVGSLAKTVVAAAFLRMATLGILTLDDPVNKYLPQLPIKNRWADTNPISIRHLLDHTSGLADVKLWQVLSTTATANIPVEYAFNRSPDLLTVQAKPGSIRSYSNIGYSILGKIIEVISGQPYEHYLAGAILGPLGMANSSFYYISQKDDKQLAYGHFDDGQPVCALPMYLRPAGQFSTTAYDMGLFLRFMMSDGKIDGKQFISEILMNSIGNQTTTDAFKNGLPMGEAMGVYKRDRYGVIGLAKNGNVLGFRSMLYLFPEFHRAFFIAFNMDSETSQYDLFNEVLTCHLNLPVKKFRDEGKVMDKSLKLWEGYYVPVITKIKPFGLLDMVFNFTKVTLVRDEALLSPFQGKTIKLLYQDNNLFSMNNRIAISHSFYKDSSGAYLITDGVNTLQKTKGIKIGAVGLSLGLGAISILYLLISGISGAIKTKTKFISNAEFPLFSVLLLLLSTIIAISSQSILALGDFGIAGVVLAIATILLPVTSIITCMLFMMKQKRFFLDVSFWASLFVFTCCLLLIANDLMPLILWR